MKRAASKPPFFSLQSLQRRACEGDAIVYLLPLLLQWLQSPPYFLSHCSAHQQLLNAMRQDQDGVQKPWLLKMSINVLYWETK